MEFGNKLCELRKKAGLSQEELSEKLDVTRQTISNWELGQTVPDIIQAKQIANIFKISLDELADNDVQNILVEKISNTEKLAGLIIKILKILGIAIILIFCMILVFIIFSFVLSSKTGQYTTSEMVSEVSKDYTYLYCSLDNTKYTYYIEYDENNNILSHSISYSGDDTPTPNLKLVNMDNYTNAQELIDAIQTYFESNGGTCEITKDLKFF